MGFGPPRHRGRCKRVKPPGKWADRRISWTLRNSRSLHTLRFVVQVPYKRSKRTTTSRLLLD